jgi:hypothetical protein
MIRLPIFAGFILLVFYGAALANETLDIEDVIEGAYLRDSANRAAMIDFTVKAESFSRKLSGDREVKEEKKFLKTYYIKDTLLKIEYREYYKDGELQEEKELEGQIKEAEERRKKGRSGDPSINPMNMFYPDKRGDYIFSMPGVEKKEGHTCYHVVVDCMKEDDKLYEGDYWFETEGLQLVYTEFQPAKMPSKIKVMEMKMSFNAVDDKYWLPTQYYMFGKGQVMIFIKFNFEVEEKYIDYTINSGLQDSFFEETEDED